MASKWDQPGAFLAQLLSCWNVKVFIVLLRSDSEVASMRLPFLT